MKFTPANADDITSEVADIFRLYGEEYRLENTMTKKQHSVMSAIQGCRTGDFGYHVDQCDNCGYSESHFNSCRDRHCPKCQAVSKHKWVAARLKDILPVAYFHIVFTLPHSLNGLTRYNKRMVYDLLMASSSKTLLTFGRDPKWLGGKIGFYGILHTWGQSLWLHPHVHYIVAGGALSADGRWIEPKYKDKFLFPVKALSEVFRGKFIEGLKAAYYQRKLVIPDDYSELSRPDFFEHWVNDLVSCQWVVYCKPPLADAEKIVRYLGRYTHRVAISNRRIFGIKNGRVYFWYKNYCSDTIIWQQMSLSCKEFIRRFLEHVLPQGYHKIRHYGILANGRCKEMIHRIRILLNRYPLTQDHHAGNYKRHCSVCTIGLLNLKRVIYRWGRMAISPDRLKSCVYAFDTS